MNEEIFSQIHGETGGAIATGVNQVELVAQDVCAATSASKSSQEPGCYSCNIAPVYPLASSCFFVYWDPDMGSFRMMNPLVYVNGTEISVDGGNNLGAGTYYCNITEEVDENKTSYTAKIQNSTDGSKVVRSIKICTISGGRATQYHVGAISLFIIGPYLYVGRADSESGYILLDARGKQPKLVLKSQDESRSITLDLSEIPEDCETMQFGIKRVKWNATTTSEDGETTTEEKHSDVIACDDIDLTGLGGGGDKDGVTSIVVGENGTALKGDVVLEADPAIVGVYAVAEGQKIRIDVNGRAADEALIVRDVVDMSEKDESTGEFGKIVSRVFATENFTINKGGDVTFVGTDGTTEATCKAGKKITFATAADSNVVVTPTADEDGNVTLTFGVYYK